MEALLVAKDVARILNLRISTVYDLSHRGVIPHVVITKGRRRSLIRYRQQDIERLIRERSTVAN